MFHRNRQPQYSLIKIQTYLPNIKHTASHSGHYVSGFKKLKGAKAILVIFLKSAESGQQKIIHLDHNQNQEKLGPMMHDSERVCTSYKFPFLFLFGCSNVYLILQYWFIFIDYFYVALLFLRNSFKYSGTGSILYSLVFVLSSYLCSKCYSAFCNHSRCTKRSKVHLLFSQFSHSCAIHVLSLQDLHPEYNLFGTIIHSGYSPDSGHYYAYIKVCYSHFIMLILINTLLINFFTYFCLFMYFSF